MNKHSNSFIKTGALGRSQTGKSTILDRIALNHKRVLLFDPNPARSLTAKNQGYHHLDDFDEMMHYVNDNYKAGFRVWYQPDQDTDALTQALSDASKFMMDYQTQFGGQYDWEKTPDLLFYADELADCFPNHNLAKDRLWFATLCRRGRHMKIHSLGASQRPADVNTIWRSQVIVRYLFNVTDPTDLAAIEKLCGGVHDGHLCHRRDHFDGNSFMAHTLTLKPMKYMDAQAKIDLAKVGPLADYIKFDREMTLSPFATIEDGKRIGTVALRGEIRPDGKRVLVIVAASVREDKSVLLAGLEIIRRMALAGRYSFIRAHVYRSPVIALLHGLGAQMLGNFATEREFRTRDLAVIKMHAAKIGTIVMLWEL